MQREADTNMPYFFDAAADFGTSLVVLTTLAWWFGAFRSWPFNAAAGSLLMGAAFGVVAILQMHAPIQPVDGMLIDLRVVPIALAGAYLGSIGLLTCLVLAVGTRVALGGVGMESGIASMLIAGLAGFAWSTMTSHLARRDWRHFLLLGGLATLSLAGGFLLPAPWSTWVFQNVAPAITVAYLTVIPLVAYLMERARTDMVSNPAPGAGGDVDTPSGLSTLDAFARQVAAMNSSAPLPRVASVLALRVRHSGMLQAYWGRKAVDQVFSALRVRLGPLVECGGLLGRSRTGKLLIGLSEAETSDVLDLKKTLERAVSGDAVTLPGGQSVRVGVDIRNIILSDPASQDAILADLAPRAIAPHPFRADPMSRASRSVSTHPWAAPDHDRLFSRLNRQIRSDD
jgi:hypothetical protein